MERFAIEKVEQVDDGIGSLVDTWIPAFYVEGYIDLLTGTDLSATQNAFAEESTHILIIPKYTEGITDKMRVLDSNNRYYSITYADNPVGMDHHNELYCKFGGDLNG